MAKKREKSHGRSRPAATGPRMGPAWRATSELFRVRASSAPENHSPMNDLMLRLGCRPLAAQATAGKLAAESRSTCKEDGRT